MYGLTQYMTHFPQITFCQKTRQITLGCLGLGPTALFFNHKNTQCPSYRKDSFTQGAIHGYKLGRAFEFKWEMAYGDGAGARAICASRYDQTLGEAGSTQMHSPPNEQLQTILKLGLTWRGRKK